MDSKNSHNCRVQEDTIIFSVLERAQFARNAPVYQPDAVPVPEFEPATGRRYSLLEYILRQTEQARTCARCYLPESAVLVVQ